MYMQTYIVEFNWLVYSKKICDFYCMIFTLKSLRTILSPPIYMNIYGTISTKPQIICGQLFHLLFIQIYVEQLAQDLK